MLITFTLSAQLNIDNNVTGELMAKTVMAPTSNVVPGSVVLKCPQGAYGTFTNGLSDGLSIEEGIVLTTGRTFFVESNNLDGNTGWDHKDSTVLDPDLLALEPTAIYDGCVLEFDVVPVCNVLRLDYIWGSDEYPEYVDNQYNDAFGFFVSGPGIVGTKNIGTIPGTNTLVSIDNVNDIRNTAYYVDNINGKLVEYDGYTRGLNATVDVIPCETYHLKIAIADAGDGIYDSGVLISVNQPPCTYNHATWLGIDTVSAEGCDELELNILRSGETNLPLNVGVKIEGTAVDGQDFTYGQSIHNFAIDDSVDVIKIPVIEDGMSESMENITLITSVENCGYVYNDSITLEIHDRNIDVDTLSSHEVCDTWCDGSISTQGVGVQPFSYSWAHTSTDSVLTNLCDDTYTVTVTDGYGCTAERTFIVNEGKALKDATITSPKDTFCLNTALATLTVKDQGIWIGAGINETTGVFSPANAGVGTHLIKNHITETCGDSAEYTLVVVPSLDPTITSGQDSVFCISDLAYVYTALTAGGTWEGAAIDPTTGNFNPSIAGVGTHRIIHKVSGSCVVEDTINVVVNAPQDASISVAKTDFCLYDDSLQLSVATAGGTWKGSGLNSNTRFFDPEKANIGTHEIIYTLDDVCETADTVNITVLRVPDATITTEDTLLCDDFGNVSLTNLEAGGSWRVISGNNPALNIGNETYNTVVAQAGMHMVSYSFTGDCPIADTVLIEIQSYPDPSIPAMGPYCNNWNNVVFSPASTGGVITGVGVVGSEFSPSTAGVGTHNITHTIGDLCVSIYNFDIEVQLKESVSIADIGEICVEVENEPTIATATNTGVWTGLGIVDPVSGGFNASLTGAGSHTVYYEIQTLCGDTASVTIDVRNPIDPTVYDPQPVCEDYTELSVTTAVPGGLWRGRIPVNFDGTIDPGVTAGEHELIYSFSSTCFSSDTAKLIVNVVPVTDFVATPNGGCTPLTTTLIDISDSNAVVSIWSFGDGISASKLDTVKNIYTEEGCFDVSVQNTYANGCSSNETKTSEVCTSLLPKADFTFSPTVIDIRDQNVSLTNLSERNLKNHWYAGLDSLIYFSAEENPYLSFSATADDTARISLIVENGAGCFDTLTQVILIENIPTFYIPNAFTPNSDGMNDYFKPYTNSYTLLRYEFYIYDRWGKLTFESTNPDESWNGRYRNDLNKEVAQEDVYVWKVIFETKKDVGIPNLRMGTVTLIR